MQRLRLTIHPDDHPGLLLQVAQAALKLQGTSASPEHLLDQVSGATHSAWHLAVGGQPSGKDSPLYLVAIPNCCTGRPEGPLPSQTNAAHLVALSTQLM